MNDLLATVITGLIKEENANDYFIQKRGLPLPCLKQKENARLVIWSQALPIQT